MRDKPQQPNIFEYTDYRVFLRDCYQALKKTAPYFSYRYFAKAAGFNTSNFYKLVADGKRNLSSEGIEKFARALKFNPRETRYFKLLVLHNQAPTPQEKDFFFKQLSRLTRVKNLKQLSPTHDNYYSHWFLLALRELVARPDFINNPRWIAQQFIPPISHQEASLGLDILLALKLIEKRADGRFYQTDTAVTSVDGPSGQVLAQHHKKMIQLGLEAVERFKFNDREISSLTIGTTKDKVKKIKRMVQEFQTEIIHELGTEPSVEEIVQLNFQLFPLTMTSCD